jgi:diacylglycerol kinase family enzyme
MDASATEIAPPRHPTCAPRLRRVEAVVNLAAGGVAPGSAETLKALLEAFDFESHVAAPSPEGIEQALESAIKAKPDLLVVLAGDGTANRAAELCGPNGPLLAPLPGGTMNMLPRALYGARDWRTALEDALTTGVERRVSGGQVGGKPFHCAAILGSPALWAPAREAARHGNFRQALRTAAYALEQAFATRLRFQLDGRPRHKAVALSLICPLISSVADDDRALEAAVLDIHDATEVFRLGLHNALGDWRRDPGVTVQDCRRGRVWAHHPIPCLIDGELHIMGRSVEIGFRAKSYRALVPTEPVSALDASPLAAI